jgi:hypothetical protein
MNTFKELSKSNSIKELAQVIQLNQDNISDKHYKFICELLISYANRVNQVISDTVMLDAYNYSIKDMMQLLAELKENK